MPVIQQVYEQWYEVQEIRDGDILMKDYIDGFIKIFHKRNRIKTTFK